jgi:hypothetical protein
MARDETALLARAKSHPMYTGTWRNNPDLYGQTARIDELDLSDPQDKALYLLLERYGEAFDQDWWYYFCTRGRGKGLFIRRVPIWQTTKKMPTEKYKPFPVRRGQKRLEEVS